MEELSPRAQAKASQIRRAAQKLFLAHGVGATSMDAITAEAGVSKQTVYAYFPSKEALLSDVLHSLVTEGAQPWAEGQPPKGPFDSWADLETALVDLSKSVIKTLMAPEYLATVRVVVAETGSNPEYGALFRRTVAEPILKSVTGVLRRAAEDGLLPEPPHEDVGRLLVGSLLTFVLLDGLFQPDDIKRPSARRVRRLVTHFISAVQNSRVAS